MPFAHATCILSRAETREHGAWLSEFWLTNEHLDWVEVGYARQGGPRREALDTARLFITRGKVGELLGQEAAREYANREALLALQSRVDALRAGEDESRWSVERRRDITAAQGALEDAFYASFCPLGVTLVALSRDVLPALAQDWKDLRLPEGRFVDASAVHGNR